MEWSDVIHNIHNLISDVVRLEKEPIHQPNWKAMDYHTHGVKVLFEEFRSVSSYGDYLNNQLQPLLSLRSDIVLQVRYSQAQLESEIGKEITTKAKSWIVQGYANSERQLLAKMNVADADLGWQKVQLTLDCLDEHIAIVKFRLKRVDDFKYAAQLLEKILNFGHALQEL